MLNSCFILLCVITAYMFYSLLDKNKIIIYDNKGIQPCMRSIISEKRMGNALLRIS